MTEDIKITADRQEVHLGEVFTLLIAPRELGRGDRVAEGVAYVIAVDDSYSMEIRADSSSDEFADPADPDDPSRKQVAEAGVRELVAALPHGAHVDVLTFAQNAGVRFSGTAGELRRRGRWNGNIDEERRWTNIEGALRRAYERLAGQRAASRRVVLFSDGIPNFGETDPGRLAALAADAAGRELHTDVIGIGAGADFGLLERLAPTGLPEHVASRTGAAEAMKQITARFAAYGRDVVAGSGELAVEINPSFQVLGVYQLDPTRRRIEGAVSEGGGRRPSQVRLKLGAIGSGEEGQPLYALRLRAPERISAGPIPVLKATGSIGTGADARPLTPAQIALRTVDNPLSPILQPDLSRQIDAIELDREITGRIAAAGSKAERERIYQEGVERARSIPDPDLAAAYQRAGGGLREGLDPKDVANEARAASSRSSTKSKRDWFQQIPVESPDEIRARRRRQSLDDDDDDEYGEYGTDAPAYGGGSGTYGSGSGTYGSGAYGSGGTGYGGPPALPGGTTEPPPGRGPR
ncbi:MULTISPECIES: vWA domain-containing protein [unclassified Streptomyces]|uniref:vWA domain-containing protein n=1 Tax=unclassified Streptomyces TaxID=2593676 RepID=UPI002555B784|nr:MULTISPECIES: vWA domain-containing protein [unclassified Streptomyces]WRZ65158.1 VWA domain-containing protein [Streptomyces sp. NBC_01257]WSU59158.1 VWA domain-containing protein [Streptomyces sp. NBC_01104]